MRPLLTFSVGAYNQERFVRQAVEGAFAQTYSPLQIILSDDCSRDGTYEIMSKMAAEYRGPHQIVLNRNPKNLGLVPHVNRLFEMMKGDMMVMCAGDDISVPDRTESVWRAWEASERKTSCIHSQVRHIEESFETGSGPLDPVAPSIKPVIQEGRAVITSYLGAKGPVVLGCTAAYTRDLFERFGPLPEELVYEDMALTFRALLSGGLAYLDAPLVLYRLHSSNIHHSKIEFVDSWEGLLADEEKIKTGLKRKLAVAKSFRRDLNHAGKSGWLNAAEQAGLSREVDLFEAAHSWELEFRSAPFFRRLGLILSRPGRGQRSMLGNERLLYRLLPRWSYYSARILKNRLRAARNHALG